MIYLCLLFSASRFKSIDKVSRDIKYYQTPQDYNKNAGAHYSAGFSV